MITLSQHMHSLKLLRMMQIQELTQDKRKDLHNKKRQGLKVAKIRIEIENPMKRIQNSLTHN